jgi:hypothetical protein
VTGLKCQSDSSCDSFLGVYTVQSAKLEHETSCTLNQAILGLSDDQPENCVPQWMSERLYTLSSEMVFKVTLMADFGVFNEAVKLAVGRQYIEGFHLQA